MDEDFHGLKVIENVIQINILLCTKNVDFKMQKFQRQGYKGFSSFRPFSGQKNRSEG